MLKSAESFLLKLLLSEALGLTSLSFTLDSGLELELLLFLLLESLMDQEPQNISVDTIYNYTESHIKSLEESITRIDARFSTFIGFSGVLIRIALDLENHSVIRFLVCLFSVIVIIISALGLVAKQRGSVLAPSALMEDKYFYETEVYQKCLIINDRIKLTEEYEGVIKNKGLRLNWIIWCFTIATIFYGIGVSGFDSFIYNFIKLQFPLKGFI